MGTTHLVSKIDMSFIDRYRRDLQRLPIDHPGSWLGAEYRSVILLGCSSAPTKLHDSGYPVIDIIGVNRDFSLRRLGAHGDTLMLTNMSGLMGDERPGVEWHIDILPGSGATHIWNHEYAVMVDDRTDGIRLLFGGRLARWL